MTAVLCLGDKCFESRIPRANELLAGAPTSRWVLSAAYQLTLMLPVAFNAVRALEGAANGVVMGFIDAPAAQHTLWSRASVYLMFAMEARDIPHLKWAGPQANKVLIIHHVAVMACCLICLAIVEEGFGAFCMGVAIFEVGSVTYNFYVLRPQIRECIIAYVIVMTLSNIAGGAVAIYGAKFSVGIIRIVNLTGFIMAVMRQRHVWHEPIRKNWNDGASIFGSAKSGKKA
jgi:hypothetical protein